MLALQNKQLIETWSPSCNPEAFNVSITWLEFARCREQRGLEFFGDFLSPR